uniref:Uncharacterized protein n=1 Tax=Aegilops tauschii TaxID=37682 RepID=M8BDM0_AEGTA|nr:uncharacterized protein LOC109756748 isoform X1 [Aegilops tauschii subsp. strangulata]XP_040259373.1 uncharacterized protein LOC109756748 isoform X1 [Aegilops tauschii subsp. strangulata]
MAAGACGDAAAGPGASLVAAGNRRHCDQGRNRERVETLSPLFFSWFVYREINSNTVMFWRPTSSCPQDPVAWKTLGAKLGKVQRDQERLLDRYDTLDALARQLRLKIAARRGQGGRSAAARHVTSTGISDSLDSDSESGMFLLGRAC